MTKYDDAWVAREEAKRAFMAENGLYSEEEEHSSCGVGLVVNIDGSSSRAVVENGIKALKAIWHRGAVDADAKKKSGAAAAAEVAALRELRRDLMAGLGWERLAAAETKKILDDYPNRVGAI